MLGLEVLGKADTIVVDGTFDKCPEEFSKCGQMYNVRAYLGSEGVTVAHAFLPNKLKSTYLQAFGQLKRLSLKVCGTINWKGKLFLVDFEQGAIGALQQTFPGATVKCCIFHFRQSLYRNLDSGLKLAFNSGKWEVRKGEQVQVPDVQNWLRLVMGMCLLPVDEIPRVWSFLKLPPETSYPELASSLSSFASYFETTYVERPAGVRRGTFFPPTLWSHWDNDDARTTNLAEGWHNALSVAFVGRYRPALHILLRWLRVKWADNQIRIEQLLAGGAPKRKERRYANVDEYIRNAKTSLLNKLSTFAPFTIGYYHAIFRFLSKSSKLILSL
jgi:hypothetical protein